VVLAVARTLAAILILFLAENLWLDPWFRGRWHRFPSLAPAPLGNTWLLIFAVLGVLSALLVVCQILLLLDRSLSRSKKLGTGFAAVCALLLFGLWFHVAASDSSASTLWSRLGKHTVTLKWKASTSVVDGYNVYRALSPGGPFVKINQDRVRGLAFVDHDVENGVKYFYQVTAVDSAGHESRVSNIALAPVP
jgi:hypothetical protein